MKLKVLFTLSLASIALASCGSQPASSSEVSSPASSSSSAPKRELGLNVACPAGAPAVSLYRYFEAPTAAGKTLEVNADPANVVAYLTEGSGKDIVICPTNAGLSAITKKNAPYKIAATLTFGNFYLASTGNDANLTLDNDDYVVAFQQNNVPDKIFKYCYPDLNNVHYVAAASDAAKVIITGKNEADDNKAADYVLIAEPALTNALSKNEKASEYASLQTVFSEKSGGKPISQASLFVSNTADKYAVADFLDEIKESVETFLTNPEEINDYLSSFTTEEVQAKFSAPVTALIAMTKRGNRMGLGFKYASENKGGIETFSALWGIEVNEEAYYK